MSKYVSATLQGGTVFDTHDKAFAHYEHTDAEFKGVFRILDANEGKVRSENVSGNMFDIRSEQLKMVAKLVAQGKALIHPDAVFIAHRKNDDGSSEYVAALSDSIYIGQDMNNIYHHVTDWDKVLSHYPLHPKMDWNPIRSDILKGIEFVDCGVNLSIANNELHAIVDRDGYSVATSPDEEEYQRDNYYLRKMGRAYLEILQEAVSLGWDGNDVLPLPETDSVQFRDLEAHNVWKSPVKRADMYQYKPDYDAGINIPSSLGKDSVADETVEPLRMK